MTEFGAKSVATEKIYAVEADVFAPCALGAVINDKTIPRLRAEIVAGGAVWALAGVTASSRAQTLKEARVMGPSSTGAPERPGLAGAGWQKKS